MEEGRSAFKVLTGKPTGKRPLGRPRRRWEENIRMNLEGIDISASNWIDSAQDRELLLFRFGTFISLEVFSITSLSDVEVWELYMNSENRLSWVGSCAELCVECTTLPSSFYKVSVNDVINSYGTVCQLLQFPV